ncbi:type II toxin-antitoxin system Phd/YefM family antitoxin [Pantoea coffeiphila]|uniref:type II toxin-antitoxin system Phd/YefM family antitoxin n=1 Tax=Pantoea coffeiphila TaxID=1465635 RepID=UPI001EF886E7|nr:type II toxin-antitoxin system Phd/YefM family antitoxin [Pantoea coffeiphila]MBM7345054.1 antitoxin StbD [Pantoea coffeiphila]
MITENILSRKTASITEFKKNPTAAMNESHGEPVAILNHNKPAFYCVPPAMFELMFEHMSDSLLLQKAVDRAGDEEIDVSWDDL